MSNAVGFGYNIHKLILAILEQDEPNSLTLGDDGEPEIDINDLLWEDHHQFNVGGMI